MINVLITSAGRRVSLVKIFKSELKKRNLKGNIHALDLAPELSPACQISDECHKAPPVNDQNYIKFLFNYCIDKKINIIIPTIDTELVVLSKNKKLFSNENIFVIISDINFIEKCRNKSKIHNFFNHRGINTAKEFKKEDYKLPLFIKPIDGSNSVDNYIIKNESDFMDYHFKNQNLMFLEYLDKKEFSEYTCDLYYGKDNKIKCIVPRKRLEVRGGEVSKAQTEKNILTEIIFEKLNKINGARGCITAQFFKNNITDKIYGIEINARFGGGYPLSYHANANYIRWIIDEYYFNKTIKFFNNWTENLLMLRYDQEIITKHE